MNTKTLLLIILLIIVLAACSFLGYTALQQTLKPNTGSSSSSKTSVSSKTTSQATQTTSLNSSVSSSLSSSKSSSLSLSSSSMSSKSSSMISSSTVSNSTTSLSNDQLRVYFTQNNSTVGSVFRTSNNTDPLDRVVDAMNAKMRGPTTAEIAEGFSKDISLTGTASCLDSAGNLLKNSDGTPWTWRLNTKGTKLIVQFCKQVTLRGSVSDGLLEQSIKKTVNAIVPNYSVVILNNQGNCLFDASGLNQCGQ